MVPERRLVSRPRFEEILVRSYSLTLGQVAEKLNESVDQGLFDRLTNAVKKRNFLAHHFWFERCHLMYSETGLSELRRELSEMSSLFNNLDSEVTEITFARMKALGISDEKVTNALEVILAGEPMESLPSLRLPKKQERIVRAWDVPMPNGSTLVFQSEDRLSNAKGRVF
jgi:hypothetical protein